MKLPTKVGKRLQHDGRLALEFDIRRHKTVLTNCFQSPPLKASRELYLNPNNPSEATIYLMQSSGGLVEGDQNDYEIDIKDHAHVCLIPQSATLIYPSHHDIWSSQNNYVTIGKGASLAYQTEAVIPFHKARFRSETVIKMAEDATLLWGEILSPGRDKRDEIFEYSDVKTNFQVWMGDECLLYDRLSFSPQATDLQLLGILEGHLYLGSLWFVAPSLKGVDMRALNEDLQKETQLKVGASLIEDQIINVRWLASDMVLLKQEMANMWHIFTDKMNGFIQK